MNKAKVLITDNQNEIKVPSGIRMLIRRCCNAVLSNEKFSDKAEVSVSFVSKDEIKQLNLQYRDKDSITDVLSFPLGENGVYDDNIETGYKMMGDIIICAQVADEQATKYGHTLQREVGFLTVHSMLHLLGYDHENGGMEARKMREHEESVLDKLGISRSDSLIGD